MAATEARVVITAQDQTAAAFRSAQASLNKFGQQTKAMLGGVKGLIAAIGVGAIANSARSVITLGDEIQKASVKAGIGGKAMSELAYAAKMSDVELSSLSTALRFMQKNMTEAATGSKSAQQAFASVGISLRALQGMDADRQFELISDAIAGINDPAQRATSVTQIFGKAGADLLPMFEQGAAGIRSAREEAEKLGVAFSPEQLDNLAKADDAIKKMGASYDGLLAKLATKASPTVVRLLEEATAMMSGDAQLTLKSDIDFLKSITATTRGRNFATNILPGVRENLPGGRYSPDELLKLQKQLESKYRLLYAPAARGGQGTYRATESSKAVGDQARADAEQARKDAEARVAAEKAWRESLAGLQEVVVSLPALDTKPHEDWLKSTESTVEQEVRVWRERDAALELQNERGLLSKEQYNLRRQELDRILNQEMLGEVELTSGLTLEAWKKSTDTLSVYAEEAARNMQGAFADFLFDPFRGGVGGMLKQFVNVIRRMVAEAAAAQIFGKPGSGGLGDAIGGFVSGLFGGVPGKAVGGPVMADKPYVVGERGPELFVPGKSGSIIPANALKAMQALTPPKQKEPATEPATESGASRKPPVASQTSQDAGIARAVRGLFEDRRPQVIDKDSKRPERTDQEKSRTPMLDVLRDMARWRKREDGGPVEMDKPYMVGEKGPELFVPRTSGGIVANDRLGQTVNVAPVYNVDARGASADLVKSLPAILEMHTRRAVEMARAAIYDDMSRGAFGRA